MNGMRVFESLIKIANGVVELIVIMLVIVSLHINSALDLKTGAYIHVMLGITTHRPYHDGGNIVLDSLCIPKIVS